MNSKSPDLDKSKKKCAGSGGANAPYRSHFERYLPWNFFPAFEEDFADPGQRIIVTAGLPLGTPGATNMLRIAYVGKNGAAGS